MNRLLVLLCLLFSLLACIDDDSSGAPVSCAEGYRQGDKFRLPDGRDVRVVAIEDHLCGCDVVCAFGGFLRIILQPDGATVERDTLQGLYNPNQRDSVDVGGFTVLLGPTYNEGFCGGNIPENELCVGLEVVR